MKNITLFKQLLYSIYSPKRTSAFRILSIGKSITYLFFLMLISLLPTLFGEVLGTYEGDVLSSLPLPLPISLTILYFFATGIKFVEITLLGGIGILFAKLQSKPLNYKQTWNLSVYATTVPTLTLAILEGLGIQLPIGAMLAWIGSTLYLFFIIKKVPRPKERK
ncbi:DUF1189 domain-containing protein [Pontibacillus yanchengensis]|uniref:DUF1189 domain-containing protein n=2 Tax=Pontibacillus yanchengensis TaxID=462910 RepID=A0A6I4ZTC4_9BACI|nr:DUF1189 family protein [Pontibacillus yanchengensis]MYL33455.1 DUF1189 domain-containing protein [Pontibacillus yanchengensis]MYL53505.1 DUF1189 domain-containing protein [Pontibacillus yanchengensis]